MLSIVEPDSSNPAQVPWKQSEFLFHGMDILTQEPDDIYRLREGIAKVILPCRPESSREIDLIGILVIRISFDTVIH